MSPQPARSRARKGPGPGPGRGWASSTAAATRNPSTPRPARAGAPRPATVAAPRREDFRRVPGWPDDVAESEEEARRPGGGGGAERAVTAAEAAAVPGPRASVRARWMWIGGGGGGGVGGPAPGLWERGGWGRCRALLAWRRPPRCCCCCCPGLGLTSTNTRWGEASRAAAPAPAPLPSLPPRQTRRGPKARGARCSPAAARALLPVGHGGAGSAGAGRRHFRALGAAWALLRSSASRGCCPGIGPERALDPGNWTLCTQHGGGWMRGDPGACQPGNTHRFAQGSGLFLPFSLPLARTGFKPWGGDSFREVEVWTVYTRTRLHPARTRSPGLPCNFLRAPWVPRGRPVRVVGP
jgi:hypothetical protein